jgi:hypothetical protein
LGASNPFSAALAAAAAGQLSSSVPASRSRHAMDDSDDDSMQVSSAPPLHGWPGFVPVGGCMGAWRQHVSG